MSKNQETYFNNLSDEECSQINGGVGLLLPAVQYVRDRKAPKQNNQDKIFFTLASKM